MTILEKFIFTNLSKVFYHYYGPFDHIDHCDFLPMCPYRIFTKTSRPQNFHKGEPLVKWDFEKIPKCFRSIRLCSRYLCLLMSGELHPEVALIDSNIGLILHAVGEYDLSLRFLEKALKLNVRFHGEQSLKVRGQKEVWSTEVGSTDDSPKHLCRQLNFTVLVA